MAELVPLAEELSCSICLEPFKVPVTTPCGHNFCGSCLDETWAVQDPPYLCPQCRAVYHARPQLRKNTVLCAVVEQFLQAEQARAASPPPDGWKPPARAAAPSQAVPVACDHCLKEPAVKTCLVCMASFCQEHLKPHLDSPAFRDHQLQSPVRDLMRRKCPQHNRLRDFFCPQHDECICHICLVEHKACSPASLSQASADLETKLKHKLTVIYSQINGASRALEDVRSRQQDVREATNRKMEQLRQEYMEIKVLIDAAEATSTRKVKEEEKRVNAKFDNIYQILLKKKSEVQALKEEVELALTKGDEFEFLEKGIKLQGVCTKPVYVPKVELNQELIKGVCQGTSDLKDELKRYIRQSQDKKPEEPTGSGNSGEHGPASTPKPIHFSKKLLKEEKRPKKPSPASASTTKMPTFGAPEQLQDLKQPGLESVGKATTTQLNAAALKAKVLETFLAKSRPELLEYAIKFSLDYNTAHNKVALSENYTVASVADSSLNYQPHPKRFVYCSQVLGLHCYKKGIHYWEVELQKSHFCGVGICYGSMPRQGPESRLGRNSASWCVEWFNTKISAWHNNVEKTLPFTKATRVGVLLNCDHGFVIFFAVTDKVHLMYKFKVDFTEAVYPAFWVFSAGAMLSICSYNSKTLLKKLLWPCNAFSSSKSLNSFHRYPSSKSPG
ncbi:E3 ubiquitin/ISG15 ligase TRIM25 isoform X3 [Callorhinus ursinus]|uniref:E3 ubiquitin/ISG15 ligase TRIM25 n=1 Tax=Callorhinus ursinus TaxID=34884 RepID=A0A3Q7MIX8_CALUR|nr:E3 ubiquitin/ISG15 ligase TRIM25 isoform X4 [Callorhinus ursinus]XP_025706861.1 E3 ubiquitin/ISG15 ligase TRIM25 isoform X4 [Callorhinus ursinus]